MNSCFVDSTLRLCSTISFYDPKTCPFLHSSTSDLDLKWCVLGLAGVSRFQDVLSNEGKLLWSLPPVLIFVLMFLSILTLWWSHLRVVGLSKNTTFLGLVGYLKGPCLNLALFFFQCLKCGFQVNMEVTFYMYFNLLELRATKGGRCRPWSFKSGASVLSMSASGVLSSACYAYRLTTPGAKQLFLWFGSWRMDTSNSRRLQQ